jgi:DegV family protein with EDD domain
VAEAREVPSESGIGIVTDSSCDLPSQWLERLRIAVVPLVVRFGGEAYRDGDLSADEFWTKSQGPDHPQTSQPSVGAFEEAFSRLLEQGKQVLCLTVTGAYSGTYSAAQLAAQRFGKAVQVLDSRAFSLGLGIQALVGAQLAQAGASMEEILEKLADIRERTRIVLVLDTLENLKRGGRARVLVTMAERMARALDIKPVINLVDGELRLMGAVRSFGRGLRRLRKWVEAQGQIEYLAVVHTRQQKLAEEMADRLAEITGLPRDRIWVRETGPVLASHGGPGIVGVLAVPAR